MTPTLRRALGIGGILLLALVVALLGQRLFTEGARGPAGTPDVGAEPEGLALRSLTVYFGARNEPGLASERRQVLAHPDLAGDLAAAMGELAAGPLSDLRPVLPRGTRLHHVFVDGSGNAYLDFSAELREGFGGGLPAEVLALRAIARTLAVNFNRVEHFVILVDGKPASTLGGHLDLSRPLAIADWE